MQEFFLQEDLPFRIGIKLGLCFGDFVLKTAFWGLTGDCPTEVRHFVNCPQTQLVVYAYTPHFYVRCCTPGLYVIGFLFLCVYPCYGVKQSIQIVIIIVVITVYS